MKKLKIYLYENKSGIYPTQAEEKHDFIVLGNTAIEAENSITKLQEDLNGKISRSELDSYYTKELADVQREVWISLLSNTQGQIASNFSTLHNRILLLENKAPRVSLLGRFLNYVKSIFK